MVIRNINEELDRIILSFQQQLELKIGRTISYKLATKLYGEIITKNIYIKGIERQKAKQKKDRKIIFKVEMKDV